MSATFNLVYHPWIPVHTTGPGRARQHSIYTSTRTKWLTLLRELKDLADARLH